MNTAAGARLMLNTTGTYVVVSGPSPYLNPDYRRVRVTDRASAHHGYTLTVPLHNLTTRG